jgi:hypothetical protein
MSQPETSGERSPVEKRPFIVGDCIEVVSKPSIGFKVKAD